MVKITSDNSIWRHWTGGAWALIGTSGAVRRDGTAILGAGIAREASSRHTGLEEVYGRWLTTREVNPFGAQLWVNPDLHMVLAPMADQSADAVLRAAARIADEHGATLVTGATLAPGVHADTAAEAVADAYSTADLIICTGHQ